jgi:hypothetical protein
MKRVALNLFAIAAALTLSTAHAQSSQFLGENVPFDAAADQPAAAAFEENFPSSDAPDVAVLLDLPADYFGEVTFPPMSDMVIEEPAIIVANLDPTETP